MNRRTFLQSSTLAGLPAASSAAQKPAASDSFTLHLPVVRTGSRLIDTAYRIALGDLAGNVTLYRSGLLEAPAPVLLAGLGYDTPWTRDAAINAWNGLPLLMPEVSRNTLVAVVERAAAGPRIIGASQYWDAVVWATGAWRYYLLTGDQPFLTLASEAVTNSLAFYEDTEFDPADGLFRGPGWSDGVSGYPAEYADCNGESGINTWPRFHPDQKATRGYGITMKALSTNCLYYNAYKVRAEMAAELGAPADPSWQRKASRLRDSINSAFWNQDRKHYRFLTGPFGPCDHQEALGHAYALLFGIADDTRALQVLENQYVAPAGVPCLWPDFDRYRRPGGDSFGRHVGTVWPQIQGMWAHAAARRGKTEIFGHELMQLAAHAVRDRQFAEVYHPLTGEIYGGLQERRGRGIVLWESQPRQSWAASAFLRMLFSSLVGMEPSREGMRFTPCVPEDAPQIDVANVHVRRCRLDIAIRGTGTRLRKLTVAGTDLPPSSPIPWVQFERPAMAVVLEVD